MRQNWMHIEYEPENVSDLKISTEKFAQLALSSIESGKVFLKLLTTMPEMDKPNFV